MTCRRAGSAKKLDEAGVAEIRARLGATCPGCGRIRPARDLASRFGVSSATISKIANGISWKGVAPAPIAATPAPALSAEAVGEIERAVSQRYPTGGNQLTAAIRMAIDLTCLARDCAGHAGRTK